MTESKVRGKQLLGKMIVGESGKRYGVVGDLSFIAESGELMNISVAEPTASIQELDLQKDSNGRFLVPFTAVKAVEDFVIVSEREII